MTKHQPHLSPAVKAAANQATVNHVARRNRAEYQGSPEWHAERRGGFGSSDVPTLVDGDEAAWNRLMLVKLGVLDDAPATESMDLGKRLEPAIAKLVQDRLGEPVIKVNRIIRHPEYPIVRASLDRVRKRGRKPIELKKWGFLTDEFGPDGSDIVPPRMFYQVQQQLAVTGQPEADLFVLFAAVSLRHYRIGADGPIIDELIGLQTGAWPFIERGEVPPWPGPAPTRLVLKADEIPADEEIVSMVVDHMVVDGELAAAKAAVDEVKRQLRAKLDEVGGTRGVLPDGRTFNVSHRRNKPTTTVDYESLYAGARKRLVALGVDVDEVEFAERALTITKEGARPLVVRIAKRKEGEPNANAS